MANEANRQQTHELRLESRMHLTVSGVQEVESFDEGAVALLTVKGLLVVRGEGLRLHALSIDGGQVAISGSIDSLSYEQAQKSGSFLKRLFG